MLKRVLLGLVGVFCFAYPIAVVGVAFDVRPTFSLAWAASALLLLEGTLLTVAAWLVYGRRALGAAFLIALLSWLVETIGVNTGLIFGAYHYSDVLFLRLPGGVPLAVIFAWLLIIFAVYGWLHLLATHRGWSVLVLVVLGGLLATLLDLAIEPVAFHLEGYWLWLNPGPISYYGVPLANFLAWFVVACVLLWLIDRLLQRASPTVTKQGSRLALLAPRLLFVTSLVMFGLVDLTHGYFGGTLCALLAGGVLVLLTPRRRHLGTASPTLVERTDS